MGEPSGGNLTFGTSGALVLGRTGPWGKEEWSCSPWSWSWLHCEATRPTEQNSTSTTGLCIISYTAPGLAGSRNWNSIGKFGMGIHWHCTQMLRLRSPKNHGALRRCASVLVGQSATSSDVLEVKKSKFTATVSCIISTSNNRLWVGPDLLIPNCRLWVGLTSWFQTTDLELGPPPFKQ